MLTPEDKERIIEEEKFRAQTKKELLGKGIERHTARWGWLIILLIFIAFLTSPLFIRGFSKGHTSTQQKLGKTVSYPTLGRLPQAGPKYEEINEARAIKIVRNYPEPGEGSIDHLLRAITLASSFVDGTKAVGWRANKDKFDNKGYRVFYVFKTGSGKIGLRQWEVDLKTGIIEARDERAQQILDMVLESTNQKLRDFIPGYPTQLSQADLKIVTAYSKTCGEIMRRHGNRSFAIAREIIERAGHETWYTLFRKHIGETQKDIAMLEGLEVPKGLERIHYLMVDGVRYSMEGYIANEKGDFEKGKEKAEKAANIFNHELPPLMQGVLEGKT